MLSPHEVKREEERCGLESANVPCLMHDTRLCQMSCLMHDTRLCQRATLASVLSTA